MAAPDVRPTARRLRETLFARLGPRVVGARFLDLCAGSGAVGIEALSRGAAHVTFIDRSAEACAQIDANLRACGAPCRSASVYASDALDFLRRAAGQDGAHLWDVAFFDPPYADDYAAVLALFASGALLRRKGGALVAEHHCSRSLPDDLGPLRRWRLVRLGASCLSFYERRR